VFQSVTLEGWSEIMVFVQKTFNVLSLFYFIPLVFIGAFFLLNLTLVVIKSKFSEEHEANKQRKRHRKYILKKISKEEQKKQQEAKVAFKKIRIKNRKIHAMKLQRRDSDNSKAESRHRKNLAKLRGNNIEAIGLDDSISKVTKDQKPESRVMTAKSLAGGNKKMRPLHAISGLHKKPKQNAMGDPITEELSNSELSMVNQNNIFYPSNLSAGGAESLNGVTKEVNVLYLKKGKKLKMEGMYGISKMQMGDGENDFGSHSDLLEAIEISGDDDQVDIGGDDVVGLKDSEVMFPLDSSLSESSKKGKKNSDSKTKAGNDKNGDGKDKDPFCISDSSYEFEEDASKLSPDKIKSNMEKKNTNYFTGTNKSSIENDVKNTAKNFLQKMGSLTRIDNGAKIKSTKISARIEGSNFGNPTVSVKNPVLKNFDIKSLLFSHLMKKAETVKKSSLFGSEAEENEETEEKNKNEDKSKIEEDIKDMEADKIVVVKKGMKIRVKGELDFDANRKTALEDILQKREPTEEIPHHPHHQKEEIKIQKTTLPPY
jgi:hypothetical protein